MGFTHNLTRYLKFVLRNIPLLVRKTPARKDLSYFILFRIQFLQQISAYRMVSANINGRIIDRFVVFIIFNLESFHQTKEFRFGNPTSKHTELMKLTQQFIDVTQIDIRVLCDKLNDRFSY